MKPGTYITIIGSFVYPVAFNAEEFKLGLGAVVIVVSGELHNRSQNDWHLTTNDVGYVKAFCGDQLVYVASDCLVELR